MIFWRIINNKLHSIKKVEQLGFSSDNAFQIPDEYLEKGEFFIMRTCHGFGDWGVISAMPRLLKEKYPNCKVYLPSEKMLENVFGNVGDFNKTNWSRPYSNCYNVFANNPHVDKFVDEWHGEIFHDHYRIYDTNNSEIPLIKQMLKFWQFDDKEMEDCLPEMYWTQKEKHYGNEIIKSGLEGAPEFGAILLSNGFDEERDGEKIKNKLKDYPNVKFLNWSFKPLKEFGLEFVNNVFDLRHIDLRIQMYIRSRAQFNIGNQCGILDTLPRYTDVYVVPKEQNKLKENIIENTIYL